jgi:hypothetical protein
MAMFEPFKIEQDQRFYLYHSLIVGVIWGSLRLENVLSISGVVEHVVQKHGCQTSIVVVRGDYGIDLSPELRHAFANLTTKYERYNMGQALVMEEEGFRASMARSAITAVNLLARSRTKQRVFKDPHEAALWVCSLEVQPPEIRFVARKLADALQKLLAELPP